MIKILRYVLALRRTIIESVRIEDERIVKNGLKALNRRISELIILKCKATEKLDNRKSSLT